MSLPSEDDRSSEFGQFTVPLQQLALHALADEYDHINRELFGGKLHRPPLRFSSSKVRVGQWLGETPELSISLQLVLERPWGVVLEVLKHEMAHQFVQQVLNVKEAPHGPVFQSICLERGIDPTATGLPQAQNGADGGVLRKVAALLSLAQSKNAHEAEAAAAAAQKLMLKYNLDHLKTGERRQFHFEYLGKPTARVQEAERMLASILSEFFFVEVLWVEAWRPLEGKSGSVLEVCGTKANVELASYVHTFLLRSAEQLWRTHKLANGITRNRDRRRFLSGVMSGFYRKLQKDAQRQAERGLVWSGDPALSGFLKARHPHVRTISYRRGYVSEAYAAGSRAGAELVLHRGVSANGTGSVRQLQRGTLDGRS